MNSQYTLGECCEFFSGTGFPVQYQGQVTGKYAFYKVGDISRNVQKGNMFLSECENYVDTETVKAIKGTVLPAGTVVFAKIGEAVKLNRRAITQAECLVDNNVMGIRPLPKYLDMSYFFFFMQNLKMERFAEATTVPSVKKSVLEKISIECPPLHIQQQIAHLFSHLDALIQEYRDMLCFFDQLVKSRFIEMFGDLANPACVWPQVKLVEACADPDDIKCGPFGTQLSKDEYRHEGIALWEIPQINSQFKANPTHYLDSDKASELDAYSIRPGDIAMSRKGNVGRCAVFPCDYSPGIIHSDVLRIRVDSGKVSPVFMMYQLHYSGGVQRQIEQVSTGAIMAGINVTKLKSITVHLPPLELQEQYAAFIAQTDKSKFSLKNGGKEAHFAVKCIWESLCRGTLT